MTRHLLPLLALTATGLTLVACATAPASGTASDTAVPFVPPAASPEPIQGYDWFLQSGEGASSLTYGLADSDDIRVNLQCEDGSQRVQVAILVPPGSPELITLESGGEVERLPAVSEPTELTDEDLLVAEARSNLPVFQRFSAIGWLAVWEGRERHAYAPHPTSQDLARRFLTKCG